MAAHWDIRGKKGQAEVVEVYFLFWGSGPPDKFFVVKQDAEYAKERAWPDAIVCQRFAVRFDDGTYILTESAKTQERMGQSGFISFSTRADADDEFKRRARSKLTDTEAQALGIS